MLFRSVDLVVEHIGGVVLQSVFHCLARGGTVVTCGATGGREVPMQLWPFFVKQHRLIGSYGRNRGDLVGIVDGLKPGQTIVSTGVFKLRNGAEVQVNNSAQPAANPAPRLPNT